MFNVSTSGSFSKTRSFLQALKLDSKIKSILHKGGLDGVLALAAATPSKTGRAASSWNYEVSRKGSVYILTFTNSDIEDGFPVVVMIQYGYGTGTGGYVQGIDYINPALRPIFDRIADEIWKAVTSA